jgi:hypothetical protein
VDRRFGPAAYAAGFRRALDSFGMPAQVPAGCLESTGEGIAAGVLKAFLQMEQFRLLYDY